MSRHPSSISFGSALRLTMTKSVDKCSSYAQLDPRGWCQTAIRGCMLPVNRRLYCGGPVFASEHTTVAQVTRLNGAGKRWPCRTISVIQVLSIQCHAGTTNQIYSLKATTLERGAALKSVSWPETTHFVEEHAGMMKFGCQGQDRSARPGTEVLGLA